MKTLQSSPQVPRPSYPSPLEVEAIKFPDCTLVLADEDENDSSPSSSRRPATRNNNRAKLTRQPKQTFSEEETRRSLYYYNRRDAIAAKVHRRASTSGATSFHDFAAKQDVHSSLSSHQQQHQYSASTNSIPVHYQQEQFEVSPGVFLPLHGTDETLAAMRADQMKFTACPACSLQVCCLDPAAFLLCPVCRTVSPAPVTPAVPETRGGVGIAISVDDYHAWRMEQPPAAAAQQQQASPALSRHEPQVTEDSTPLCESPLLRPRQRQQQQQQPQGAHDLRLPELDALEPSPLTPIKKNDIAAASTTTPVTRKVAVTTRRTKRQLQRRPVPSDTPSVTSVTSASSAATVETTDHQQQQRQHGLVTTTTTGSSQHSLNTTNAVKHGKTRVRGNMVYVPKG